MRYYLSLFLRRLPIFLVVAVLISGVAISLAMTLPPAYVSNSRLAVERPKIDDPSGRLAPELAQLQIAQGKLMTRANLLMIADIVRPIPDQNNKSPDEIENWMRSHTSLWSRARQGEATFLDISFEARDPEHAAWVLDEYLKIMAQIGADEGVENATQKLEFFERLEVELRQKLADQNARILEFKSSNLDALPESLDVRLNQQGIVQDRIVQFDRDRAVLQDQRVRLMQIFESTGRVAGTPSGPNLTPEQQQLRDLRAQLNDALALYSSEHPQVRVLEAKIKQLEQVVRLQPVQKTEPGTTGNPLLDTQLADIDARIADIDSQKKDALKQLAGIEATIEQTPINGIRLDELMLERDNIQIQYNDVRGKLADAAASKEIIAGNQGQRVVVIEPPSIPDQPSKPNRLIIAAGGTFFGIMAGIGIVVLLLILDQSIHRPQDLVARLNVTPLATIPNVVTAGDRVRARLRGLAWGVAVLIGISVIVYAVHIYYQPLDEIFLPFIEKLGIA
ncbi:hypothetical protein [Ruegeria sp.]|uniref:GumC family protein n=1 Tax=Ruegeria sp. TaxID=1879320 RepID=UPI0023231BAC|nr:hypothetical protein [Ruegeria sp.]MDA7965971.1 hypothetical protein [Ruegeria sp.]